MPDSDAGGFAAMPNPKLPRKNIDAPGAVHERCLPEQQERAPANTHFCLTSENWTFSKDIERRHREKREGP
jgi:hypothetical protein